MIDLCPPLPVFAVEHERALMRLSDEDIVNGATARSWASYGLDANVLIMHRDFLRDGRKVYQLAPDAAEQLATIPAHWPDLGARKPETWCLRLPFPIAVKGGQWNGYYVRYGPVQDNVGLLDGDNVIEPLPGARALPSLTFFLCGQDAKGQSIVDDRPAVILNGDQVEDHPDGPEETARGRVLVNAVAAILDQRVSQVVAHPRHGREGREYQRRGISVSTLRLSADGLHTWRTKLIGPADGDLTGGTHAVPCAHVCHEHTARYWMSRTEHPDLVPELDADGCPIMRQGARGPLVAVRRPVREHVRGAGSATVRVTKVRSDAPVPPRPWYSVSDREGS